MKLSNLRKIVLVQFAKGFNLGLDIPVSRIVKVFNLNGSLTYRFVRELESEGIVEKTGRGRWMLRDTSKARALAEYALELWREEYDKLDELFLKYSYFPPTVPDVYYYMPELPTPWFGTVAYILIIADPVLKGRINPPESYKVVYTSLRGRKIRFDIDKMMPVGVREQSIADFLSYDPYWDIELYMVWNYGDFDFDEVARRCSDYGLKRLASFLSFFRMAVGKPVATSFNFIKLLDKEVYREYLPMYYTWIFANGVAERRNI